MGRIWQGNDHFCRYLASKQGYALNLGQARDFLRKFVQPSHPLGLPRCQNDNRHFHLEFIRHLTQNVDSRILNTGCLASNCALKPYIDHCKQTPKSWLRQGLEWPDFQFCNAVCNAARNLKAKPMKTKNLAYNGYCLRLVNDQPGDCVGFGVRQGPIISAI